MAGKKIKIDGELYHKAKQYAETAGYSSVDEFITHMLEKALSDIGEGGDSIEEVEKRLRGLGYIS
jgi:predicted CopG family antitoxin